jgi:RimJ/RimL family protein N-acetyltransferase
MNILLVTKQLLLRPIEISDLEVLFELNKNSNVHKYLWQKPEQVIDESIKVIEYV